MSKAGLFVGGVTFMVAAAFILPALVLVGCAFDGDRLSFPPDNIDPRWFARIGSNSWLATWLTTFTVCGLAVLIVCGTAVPLAFLARRVGRVGRVVLFVAAAHSLFLPLVLYGLVLRRLAGYAGLLDHPLGLALGHAGLALPLALWAVYGDVSRLRPEGVLAARSLGASWGGAFRAVVWPVIRRGVVRAGALAAVVSLGDVTLCVYLSRIELQTVGSRLWVEMQFEYTPLAAAASVVLIGLGGAAYFVAISQVHRRRDQEG